MPYHAQAHSLSSLRYRAGLHRDTYHFTSEFIGPNENAHQKVVTEISGCCMSRSSTSAAQHVYGANSVNAMCLCLCSTNPTTEKELKTSDDAKKCKMRKWNWCYFDGVVSILCHSGLCAHQQTGWQTGRQAAPAVIIMRMPKKLFEF